MRDDTPPEYVNRFRYDTDAVFIYDLDGTLADVRDGRHFVNEHHAEERKKKGLHVPSGLYSENGKFRPDYDAFAKYGCRAPLNNAMRGPLYYNRLEFPAAHVIIVSGRMNTYRDETVHWLVDNKIHFCELYMRRAGDHRPDTVVKREIYETYIAPAGSPVIKVYDDRPSVIEMWRELGLNCIEVPGWEE